MPTYEYTCTACGHAFERFESITAKPKNKCPECHKNTGQRTISGGAGLIFKGSGFYITDYRSSSYNETAKKEGSSAPVKGETKSADSSKSTSKSSDSKPAPKPASKKS